MKTAIIYGVIFLIIFVLLAGIDIQFKPFKIQIFKFWQAVGIFLIILGIVVLILSEHREAYAKGLGKGRTITLKLIKENFDLISKDKLDKN